VFVQPGYVNCDRTGVNYGNICLYNDIQPFQLLISNNIIADPSGRAVSGVGLRPLVCWHCGFESRRGHRVCVLLVLCFVR